jgi:drug/metabolite transporter (DMT)-like permease
MRVAGSAIGMVGMFAVILLRGRSLRLPRSAWPHVVVLAFCNVVAFNLLSAFAQLEAATSRVVIINYSMPIWASLMAWLLLGERLTPVRIVALGLCAAGLGVLVYPLAQSALPVGLLLALGCALSWASGTIYMKWARIQADLLAVTAWQLVISLAVFLVGLPIFEGELQLPTLPLTMFAVAYSGLIGSALAYLIWFEIVGRLPTATASLGTLATPVVGVVSAGLVLGERPTVPDVIGFALIFAAAACVLLQPVPRPLVPSAPARPVTAPTTRQGKRTGAEHETPTG